MIFFIFFRGFFFFHRFVFFCPFCFVVFHEKKAKKKENTRTNMIFFYFPFLHCFVFHVKEKERNKLITAKMIFLLFRVLFSSFHFFSFKLKKENRKYEHIHEILVFSLLFRFFFCHVKKKKEKLRKTTQEKILSCLTLS